MSLQTTAAYVIFVWLGNSSLLLYFTLVFTRYKPHFNAVLISQILYFLLQQCYCQTEMEPVHDSQLIPIRQGFLPFSIKRIDCKPEIVYSTADRWNTLIKARLLSINMWHIKSARSCKIFAPNDARKIVWIESSIHIPVRFIGFTRNKFQKVYLHSLILRFNRPEGGLFTPPSSFSNGIGPYSRWYVSMVIMDLLKIIMDVKQNQ